MSIRHWVFASALGLTLATSGQAQDQPATEDQPGQEEGISDSENATTPEQQQPFDPIAALQGIEAAIRDLVAESDEGEQDRAERDLRAQEEMAQWAFWMFISSAASVVLTFFALLAIVRTLVHTKRAADSAEGMLDEASATTVAANETIEVTRDIGQAQVRAYLGLEMAGGVVEEGKPLLFHIKITNHGQSPAINVASASSAVVRRNDWRWGEDEEIIKSRDAPPAAVLYPKGGYRISVDTDPPTPLSATHIEGLRKNTCCAFGSCIVLYEDVFGQERESVIRFEFSGEECFRTGEARVAHRGGYDGKRRG